MYEMNKVTNAQIKELNKILSFKNDINKFRLCMMWLVDVYTQTINRDLDIKNIIKMYSIDDNMDLSAECLFSMLNNTKQELVEINEKLEKQKRRYEKIGTVDRVIQQAMGDECDDKQTQNIKISIASLNDNILNNKRRIDKLNNVSIAQINKILEANAHIITQV